MKTATFFILMLASAFGGDRRQLYTNVGFALPLTRVNHCRVIPTRSDRLIGAVPGEIASARIISAPERLALQVKVTSRNGDIEMRACNYATAPVSGQVFAEILVIHEVIPGEL